MILKKKHIIALTTAATLFAAASANASLNGAYVGGTLGWGDVHENIFAPVGVAFVPGTSYAFDENHQDTGLAGRGYLGYKFDSYFAAELGYTRFHNATSKSYSSSTIYNSAANGTIQTDAFDLVGKGIIPLPCNFNVYGKLGVAYLRAKGSVYGTTSMSTMAPVAYRVSQNAHDVYPTFGTGVGYDITKNISTDVSWNRIQKVGNNSGALPSTDLFGVGLTYTFG